KCWGPFFWINQKDRLKAPLCDWGLLESSYAQRTIMLPPVSAQSAVVRAWPTSLGAALEREEQKWRLESNRTWEGLGSENEGADYVTGRIAKSGGRDGARHRG